MAKEELTFSDWDEIGAELGKELTDRLYHEHVFHRPLTHPLDEAADNSIATCDGLPCKARRHFVRQRFHVLQRGRFLCHDSAFTYFTGWALHAMQPSGQQFSSCHCRSMI